MSMYNMLFGRNPASKLLLAMLDLTEGDTGRFRDCYLQEDPENGLVIVIYTRNGGGNREAYEDVTSALQDHEEYITDYDDDFDNTYASYVFSVPEKFKETAKELAKLGAKQDMSPADKFKALIEKLGASDKDSSDPDVQRALKLGQEIFGQIDEVMKKKS